MGLKYSKVHKSRIYSNLVKDLIDIRLYKNFSSTYLG